MDFLQRMSTLLFTYYSLGAEILEDFVVKKKHVGIPLIGSEP